MQYRVLLLDLSLRRTGWAVVDWDENDGFSEKLLTTAIVGEIPLTDTTISLQQRLGELGAALSNLVDTYTPDFVGCEMPKNVYQARPGGRSVGSASSSMMQQRAFGVAMYAYWDKKIPFIEVDPSLSKYCLTDKKQASKQFVAECMARKLNVPLKARGYAWPKGWTEAVRDAMAVLAFISWRRYNFENQPGGWLAHLLHEQNKPFLGIDRLDLTDPLPKEEDDYESQRLPPKKKPAVRKRTAKPVEDGGTARQSRAQRVSTSTRQRFNRSSRQSW